MEPDCSPCVLLKEGDDDLESKRWGDGSRNGEHHGVYSGGHRDSNACGGDDGDGNGGCCWEGGGNDSDGNGGDNYAHVGDGGDVDSDYGGGGDGDIDGGGTGDRDGAGGI